MIENREVLRRLREHAEQVDAGPETVERITGVVAGNAGRLADALRELLGSFLDEQDHDGRDVTGLLLADVAGAAALPDLTMADDRDLGDTPYHLRELIDQMLRAERPAAREALLGMMTGGSVDQCRVALDWIGPVLTAADVPLLAACATRPEPEIRVLAVEAVPEPGTDDRAYQLLTGALRDTDGAVRLAAVSRLGEALRPESVGPLATLTADSDPRVRARAAYALGRIGAASGGRTGSASVRGGPGSVAGERGSGSVAAGGGSGSVAGGGGSGEAVLLAALGVFLRDEDERVRGRAGEALGAIGGDPAVGVLLSEAVAADPRQRVRAAKGLAYVVDDDPRAEPVIRGLAADPDASVRAAVLSGLATVGDITGRWSSLVDGLATDADVTVRHRVVGTVAHLHPYPRKVLNVLVSDPSGFVREAAVTTLAKLR
ncbi:HEAT repeat domain-containing protein [Actinoplanes sp. NPDC026670]|uniref:HEAT repeat domain-containing protein n=1 Tax=Actinoplanes sp. NPDC026670 TaxID=3154700 RepID=UPI0033D1E79D